MSIDPIVAPAGVTPLDVLAPLVDAPGTLLLDGGRAGPWSVLLWSPDEVVTAADAWPSVGRRLTGPPAAGPAGLPFVRGVAGYIGYDAGWAVEAVPRHDPTPEPPVWLGRYAGALVYEHASGRWFATGDAARRREARALLGSATPQAPLPGDASRRDVHLVDAAAWQDAVRAALTAIADGEVYQVNLTHVIGVTRPEPSWAAWRRLRERHGPSHGAWLRVDARTTVLSLSPETLLHADGPRVRTVPIKGTRPGSGSPEELLRSAKEVAELTMIVDLCRNDLGRTAAAGSVSVQPRRVEGHGYVFHAAQAVSARLRPGLDAWDALAGLFPPGSVTGCPKVRAATWIRALEPAPRGVYCGAIGFASDHGVARWSVAIRTAVHTGDHARVHVGAGIVADSDPAEEWLETLDKGVPLVEALAGAAPWRRDGHTAAAC